jgi:hypothetical protein
MAKPAALSRSFLTSEPEGLAICEVADAMVFGPFHFVSFCRPEQQSSVAKDQPVYPNEVGRGNVHPDHLPLMAHGKSGR